MQRRDAVNNGKQLAGFRRQYDEEDGVGTSLTTFPEPGSRVEVGLVGSHHAVGTDGNEFVRNYDLKLICS